MTTTQRFVRPARMVRGPKAPAVTELRLAAPSELPKSTPQSKLRIVLMVVMVAAMVGMMAMMFRGGGGRAMSPMMLFFPVMMMVSMFGMFGMQAGGGGKGGGAAELNEDRKDFLRSFGNNRETVFDAEHELHDYLHYIHPGPAEVGSLIGGKRMWEVQAAAPNFLRVRVGRGRIANQVRVIVPEAAPLLDLDPVGLVEVVRFAKAYSTVDGMQVAMNLVSVPQVVLDGDPDAVAGLVRAMLAEIAVLHGPDQVAIAAVLPEPDAPEWSWLKWLPHTQHPTDTDGLGPSRMVYRTVAELRTKVVAGLNRGPFSANSTPSQERAHYILLVVADGAVNERDMSGIDGCTWLCAGTVEQPLPRSMRFTVAADGALDEITSRGTRRIADVDRMSVSAATGLARHLSPYRLTSVVEAVASDQVSGTSWPELVGLPDPGNISIAQAWPPLRDGDRSRLNVPFAYDPAGAPVFLDIKESAEEGMGPHGMCIGATGSGKSEFLRTLVLSLVATHSPDAVNLLLVDFKGGATFLGFDRLAHVTAVVTNMEEEAELVSRMEDVLYGELERRQRVLRESGNFANVADYERAREQGADLSPLPTLFIILDEFAELLGQYPDFAKLFVAVGRLGRSLRVHLLLASQKVPASRMGELEAHLSYRIALRTNQTSDSRDAIGSADAYHLPKKPGSGYLRVGSGDLQRFQVAYIGDLYVPPRRAGDPTPGRSRRGAEGYAPPQLFTASAVSLSRPPVIEPPPEPDAPEEEKISLMDAALQQLAGLGRPAHRMWLPPLGIPPTLDQLVGIAPAGALRFPLALVDKPRQQRQDIWEVDLSGAGGHIAIVGGPQSGKSTAVQTLIMSAALTHTPEQVQFYCLDFSGGALLAVRNVPHVGSVANARDLDRIRRTIALITNLIESRQQLFADLGIDTMRRFRSIRNGEGSRAEAAALAARDAFGDVFLVIDGWDVGFSTSGPFYDEYMAVMESIAVQGLNYGVHLVITSSRWAPVRPAIKDMMQNRIEMRLGDLTDTVFNAHRDVVRAIPADRPGRCISTNALHMLTALPRTDGIGDPGTVADGITAAIEDLTHLYGDRRAPEVKLLPALIDLAAVRAVWPPATTTAGRLVVPFGVRESDLGPAAIDFGVSTHFIVLGASGCGRSTVLAALLASIRAQFDADTGQVLLIDYRRRHMDALPPEQLIGHLTSEREVTQSLPDLVEKMRSRRPPDGVTARQLADRSWWTGPEVFVVIDDYHMVVQRGALNPLEPLKDIIVDGRDTGLHVVVARNIAQADSALYDNVVGQMKNLNCSGFIMDGSRLDGMLIGDVKATKQPPGRGIFVEPMSSRKDLVQTAWVPPME